MSEYRLMNPEQLEELLSNYLVESWSYSKVSSFARNEKAFEMTSIFGVASRRSSTTIAGEAYHEALSLYFNRLKAGEATDIIDMEAAAFSYIDAVPANKWKMQKTTPTIEEARQKATATVASLIRNFYAERDVYESDIEEVLDVEIKASEWVTVNGVDIPLPLHFVIDLVVRTKSGSIAIIDHKSKNSFTDEEEVALSIGIQAITYVLGYEARTGQPVNEVWFVENKYSTNKNKTPQLSANKVRIDLDTRRLYEALLYEPLRRMIQAVSDPDYVFLINASDNFVDKAELYDFWARTQICEVEDFNVLEAKKELVLKRLKKIRDSSIAAVSPTVIKRFRENAAAFIQYDLSFKDMAQTEKIEHVLRSFGIIVKVAHHFDGYSSSTYLLEFSAGVQVTSVYKHRLDIANALDVATVRIHKDLIVYGGKSYLGIDFTKKREQDLIFEPEALVGRKIPLGRDNLKQTIVWDLDNHSTPHALICGATGSGKSVQVRTVIEYALMGVVDRVVIMDPKFEFLGYNGMRGVEVYNDIDDIEVQMANLVDDMQMLVKRGGTTRTLVVFDEFADAIANSRKGNALKRYEFQQVGAYANGQPKMAKVQVGEDRPLEENLRILLQKGRSIGYRIVAATQRASTKVITGDAKVNFPVQICFRVPKETDSRVVIDEGGAEGLGGMGDGLIKSPEYKDVVRFQAFYKPAATDKKVAAQVEELVED
jgi:hypothetical protein